MARRFVFHGGWMLDSFDVKWSFCATMTFVQGHTRTYTIVLDRGANKMVLDLDGGEFAPMTVEEVSIPQWFPGTLRGYVAYFAAKYYICPANEVVDAFDYWPDWFSEDIA